jgi:hypothetical protein
MSARSRLFRLGPRGGDDLIQLDVQLPHLADVVGADLSRGSGCRLSGQQL